MTPGQPIIPTSLCAEEAHLICDVASERAMLSILMLHPPLIIEAERTLHNLAFTSDLNSYIYKFMIWLAKEAMSHGRPYSFDALTMLSWAKYLGAEYEKQFLQKTDMLNHLQGLEQMKNAAMVAVTQFDQYAYVLNDRAKRLEMYNTARELQKAALDFKTHPVAKDIAIKASTLYGTMAFDTKGTDEARLQKLGVYRENAMAKIDIAREFKHDMLFNVPCYKYRYWMTVLSGGFFRKGLHVLCARPKVGKSTLMLDIATEMAIGQIGVDLDGNPLKPVQTPVLYLDTEMSGQEMFFRQLSHVSNVLESDIMAGKLHEEGVEWKGIQAACDRMADAPFYYVNIAGKDMDFVTSVMRQFRNEVVGTQVKRHSKSGKDYTFSRAGMVMYDWMKLPDGGGLKHAQETQLIGFQAQALKNAAYELDLPVIAGAQLNRDAVRATPADWEWNAENFISASDRLAMFCNVMCVLRNSMPEEIDMMQVAKPDWMIQRKDPKTGAPLPDHQGLRFNQRLHQILGRSCGLFRQGIPLYIDRGHARYEELGDKDTIDYVKSRAAEKPPENDNKKKKGVPDARAVQGEATTAAKAEVAKAKDGGTAL